MDRSEEYKRAFWELVDPMLERGAVEKGTIMGHACIRAQGEFLAMPTSKQEAMVIKLNRVRVKELIDGGVGEPFAPAGRVFKEWVAVPYSRKEAWSGLIQEGAERLAEERPGD